MAEDRNTGTAEVRPSGPGPGQPSARLYIMSVVFTFRCYILSQAARGPHVDSNPCRERIVISPCRWPRNVMTMTFSTDCGMY